MNILRHLNTYAYVNPSSNPYFVEIVLLKDLIKNYNLDNDIFVYEKKDTYLISF